MGGEIQTTVARRPGGSTRDAPDDSVVRVAERQEALASASRAGGARRRPTPVATATPGRPSRPCHPGPGGTPGIIAPVSEFIRLEGGGRRMVSVSPDLNVGGNPIPTENNRSDRNYEAV